MVVEPASVHACIRASLRPFTFSKIFFSETAWPIKAKFYVEHPWVGGTKVCVGEKVEIGIFHCQAGDI